MSAPNSECKPHAQHAGSAAVHGFTLHEDVTTDQLALTGVSTSLRRFSPESRLMSVIAMLRASVTESEAASGPFNGLLQLPRLNPT